MIAAVVFLPRFASAAQREPTEQTALRDLFPASNQVAGWALQAPPRFYAGDQVFDYMDGAGEIPRGYGLRRLGTAKYQSGKTTFEVAIFDMGSSANAFGYYSARSYLEHNPRIKDRIIPLDHPARLYPPVGVLTLWKDRYTIIVQPDIGRPPDNVLIEFAKLISRRIRAKGSPPALLRRLPPGAIPGTERYVRGKAAFDSSILFSPKDVLGAGKGAEAVAAEYPINRSVCTLIVVRYPNASDARSGFNGLTAYVLGRTPPPSPASFVGQMRREKGIGAVIRGNELGVVTGALHAVTVQKALGILGGR